MARIRHRRSAYVETGLAVLTAALGLLTIFWPDWIEGLTGWDPDQHDGAAEVFIVVGLLAVSGVLAIAARRSWRVVRTGLGSRAPQ